MNHREKAAKLFQDGFNCAQSVFTPLAVEMGLNEETALKVSCGFGGGMGRMQETCGAVTGAFMAFGLKFGKFKKEDDEARAKTYSLVKEFYQKFTGKFGSANCLKITGCDFSNPEDHERFKRENLHRSICEKCVTDAVEMAEELMGL